MNARTTTSTDEWLGARITTMLQLKHCAFAGAHDAKLATRTE
ncbi:hypothetical protein HMPREF0733_10594 [Rothia dentocariosa ATCC 17931]|uniref:Uncharacterized protein n=1 Tax=Rothia dentocariosa (strain ATCC 17931 / CDC X599 / XDIA) TaxID=762948 RepID=E3H149_ROTDC|nr:hypothetical protein HMPREF0733_10594 [Rothia dentocariosa ATCC 17931]